MKEAGVVAGGSFSADGLEFAIAVRRSGGGVAAMAAGLADLVARAAWSMTRVGRGMRRILAQP